MTSVFAQSDPAAAWPICRPSPFCPAPCRTLRPVPAQRCCPVPILWILNADVFLFRRRLPPSVPRCLGFTGLFHSTYSNSFVKMALFKPDVDREVLRALIGPEAEEWVHLFCVIPRYKTIILDTLLKGEVRSACPSALAPGCSAFSASFCLVLFPPAQSHFYAFAMGMARYGAAFFYPHVVVLQPITEWNGWSYCNLSSIWSATANATAGSHSAHQP